MISIEQILLGAGKLINDFIKHEWQAQGHHLTGSFEESMEAKVVTVGKRHDLIGYGAPHGKIVNDGIVPEKIKRNMIPGLIQYFMLRGLDQKKAEQAAQMTFKKWESEGMSTQASKRFSATGARQHFIEAAFIGNEPVIDEYLFNLFDFGIEEKYRQVKNETI